MEQQVSQALNWTSHDLYQATRNTLEQKVRKRLCPTRQQHTNRIQFDAFFFFEY